MSLPIVIGVIGCIGLILYLAHSLEDKHFLLRLLLVFFAVGAIILIPTAVVNEQTCEVAVNQSVTVGNITTNTHYHYCYTTPNTTNTTFFNAMRWLIILFTIYVMGYLAYEALFWLKDRVRGE